MGRKKSYEREVLIGKAMEIFRDHGFAGTSAEMLVQGDLRRSVDPRGEADFFTASVLGLFVMLRAKAPTTVIQSATRVVIEHLEELPAEASN